MPGSLAARVARRYRNGDGSLAVRGADAKCGRPVAREPVAELDRDHGPGHRTPPFVRARRNVSRSQSYWQGSTSDPELTRRIP